MRKRLLKNLLLTFVLSLLLTGLLYAIWYGSKQRGFEEGQALKILFFIGNLFQNMLLTLATLPVLLLTNPDNFRNQQTRVLSYFGGPILLTVVFVLFVANSWVDRIGFLLPGISFNAIHSYFYVDLMKR